MDDSDEEVSINVDDVMNPSYEIILPMDASNLKTTTTIDNEATSTLLNETASVKPVNGTASVETTGPNIGVIMIAINERNQIATLGNMTDIVGQRASQQDFLIERYIKPSFRFTALMVAVLVLIMIIAAQVSIPRQQSTNIV